MIRLLGLYHAKWRGHVIQENEIRIYIYIIFNIVHLPKFDHTLPTSISLKQSGSSRVSCTLCLCSNVRLNINSTTKTHLHVGKHRKHATKFVLNIYVKSLRIPFPFVCIQICMYVKIYIYMFALCINIKNIHT